MFKQAALRIALLGALAALLGAAPAAAFTPPVLYVRLTVANSTDHRSQSDWMALSAMPNLNWLGGYELGYALQEAGTPHEQQHVGIQITGTPGGPPIQPMNKTPFCAGEIGRVGDIVAIPYPLQFQGSGVYAVTVSLGPSSGTNTDCFAPGPATARTSATFTAGAAVVPQLVGRPMVFRDKALTGDRFVGVRAPDPPAGDAEVSCARDAKVHADGSVSGKVVAPKEPPAAQVAEQDFTRPGAWTCVARGDVEGVDASFDGKVFSTPWSALLHVEVRSDFRRREGRISMPRSRHPRLRFTAEFPEAAAGGTVSFRLRQAIGCRRLGPRHYDYRYGPSATSKAKFDSKSATVTVTRPRTDRFAGIRYYVGTLSFSGTRDYVKSVDPNPSLLKVTAQGVLSFVDPTAFPVCPNFG